MTLTVDCYRLYLKLKINPARRLVRLLQSHAPGNVSNNLKL